MKKKIFEREWRRRLEENKRLVKHQLMPESLRPLAAEVGVKMTWIFGAVSLAVVGLGFSLWGDKLLWLSRKMLLLP